MVYLYAADVSNLPDGKVCAELLEVLPKERQQKIRRSQKDEQRKQSLGAGLLLEKVFEKHGVCTKDITFAKHGKPEVEGLYFNLSHSGSMVVCAVSEKPVGCDIEKCKTAPKKVAEHFFGQRELDYLKELKGDDYDRAFFRLWTMKESYVKMTGEGASIPFRSFEVVLGLETHVFREELLQTCEIKEYDIPGYQVAVCTEDAGFSEMVFISL